MSKKDKKQKSTISSSKEIKSESHKTEKDTEHISKDDLKAIQDNLEKTAKHDLKEYKKRQKKLEQEEKKKLKEKQKLQRQKEKEERAKEEEELLKQKRLNKIKLVFFIIICLVLTVLYSRFIGTSGLVVKEYPIRTGELSTSYDGFKIVQFSDLHYGTVVHGGELENLVEAINKQNPDIIVFTGDLIDKTTYLSDEDIGYITWVLNGLNPKIEIIAVKGNHDYEHDYWDKIVSNLNWIVLDNNYEYVYKNDTTPIIFVGLDDSISGKPDYYNAFSFLNEVEKQSYTIVLMHEPDQIENFIDNKFNLVFAGHSMLGQVRLPFLGTIYKPEGARKYYEEKYIIGDAEMYISSGIGTNYIKYRFLNRPSINLYRFYTK